MTEAYRYLSREETSSLQGKMPSDEELYCVADLFKLFSDSTRVRILTVLSMRELCVSDLSALCEMSLSAVSHQLRLLKQARLIKCRREGKTVFYALADDHVYTIIRQGLEHINE